MPARLNTGLRLVELAGPAGVGKSTLAQVLRNRCAARSGTIWGQPMLPLIGNGLQLLPTLFGFWRQSHALLWDESRHVVRLQTLQKALRDAPPAPASIIVFDEGPVFALAWLRGFGHESMRRDAAEDWWRTSLQEWAQTIDAVVVLDASDDVLARRIRARPNWHEVKELSDQEIATWMGRFRVALDWVLAGLAATGRVVIVRVSIDREQPDHIAERVVAALQSVSHDN